VQRTLEPAHISIWTTEAARTPRPANLTRPAGRGRARARAGPPRLSPLVIHRFPLEAYEEAYQVLRNSSGPRGKVILEVSVP